MTRSRTGSLFLCFVFLLLVGFVWAVVGPQVAAVAAQQAVQVSQHGLDKHAEAALIETCLNKNGSFMNFKDLRDKDKFYKTCLLPDGRWGLAPFVKNGNRLYNKTAFVRGGGTWKELCEYLKNLATRYNGELPVIDIPIEEKYFVVRFSIDGRTGQATIGMVQYDPELARAIIADHFGRKLEEVLVLSHRSI